MKNFLLLLIVLLLFNYCRTNKPVVNKETEAPVAVNPAPDQDKLKFADMATWILGYFRLDRLTRPPHSEWYIKGYDDYQVKREYTDSLKQVDLSDVSIKIVLGTWCPDSRREVPRFMRIIDAIDFPHERMEFIGVDDVKISPIENYDSLDIVRVPTFIFFRNNIEIGRIIENPVTSLEQDMVNIIRRNEK